MRDRFYGLLYNIVKLSNIIVLMKAVVHKISLSLPQNGKNIYFILYFIAYIYMVYIISYVH